MDIDYNKLNAGITSMIEAFFPKGGILSFDKNPAIKEALAKDPSLGSKVSDVEKTVSKLNVTITEHLQASLRTAVGKSVEQISKYISSIPEEERDKVMERVRAEVESKLADPENAIFKTDEANGEQADETTS